jgi:uncharacterized protein YcbX
MNSISRLFLYPFKSLAPVSVGQLEVLPDKSIRFDRKWMLIDAEGNFLTQRRLPQLARFNIKIIDDLLFSVSFNSEEIQFPATPVSGKTIGVKVWQRSLKAILPNDQSLGNWFSNHLGQEVRAVHFSSQLNESHKRKAAFSDSSPLLVISQGSLSALNARFTVPFSPLHFRPNIILSSDQAFIEDDLSEIATDKVQLKPIRRCSRCIMVNVNPQNGLFSESGEPLKTLSAFRRFDDGKVKFGVYFSSSAGVLKSGTPYSIKYA